MQDSTTVAGPVLSQFLSDHILSTVCYGTAAALSEPLLAAFNSSVHDNLHKWYQLDTVYRNSAANCRGSLAYPASIMVPISPSDIITLINAIAAAAETVQGSREQCQVIAERVNNRICKL